MKPQNRKIESGVRMAVGLEAIVKNIRSPQDGGVKPQYRKRRAVVGWTDDEGSGDSEEAYRLLPAPRTGTAR